MSTSQPACGVTAASANPPFANESLAPGAPVASALHTVALLVFLTGWAYFGREWAIHMRAQATPNHLLLYIPTFLMEWLVFAYIVWGVKKRGISLKELVGPRWSKGAQNLVDLGIAACFELVSLVILALTAHLLRIDPKTQNMKFMMPVGGLEIFAWVLLSLTAGICEETIFRGYLQRQFGAWSGNVIVGIVISAAVFGAGHIYQGWKQAVVIGVFGILFGALTVLRRSLKPGMMAHSFQDAAAGIAFGLLGK
jgi:membrane protease YdiL (CAAX protease family)